LYSGRDPGRVYFGVFRGLQSEVPRKSPPRLPNNKHVWYKTVKMTSIFILNTTVNDQTPLRLTMATTTQSPSFTTNYVSTNIHPDAPDYSSEFVTQLRNRLLSLGHEWEVYSYALLVSCIHYPTNQYTKPVT
jgi:hypothetical protein